MVLWQQQQRPSYCGGLQCGRCWAQGDERSWGLRPLQGWQLRRCRRRHRRHRRCRHPQGLPPPLPLLLLLLPLLHPA